MYLCPASIKNLGDLCNTLPVISGLVRSRTQAVLVLHSAMHRFKGLVEFLEYQPDIERVMFMEDTGGPVGYEYDILWRRADSANPARPRFTAQAANCLRDRHGLDFEVNDAFQLLVPEIDIEIGRRCYIGDRWSKLAVVEQSKKEMGVPGLPGDYLDYDLDLRTNAYLVKNSPMSFVSCFTGISIIAELLGKQDNIVSWRQQDFVPSLWRGEDISYGGRSIREMFVDHYYADRGSRLVHFEEVKAYVSSLS